MTNYYAGLDIGSTMTKAVIMDDSEIIATFIGSTGAQHRKLANRVMEQTLEKAGISFEDITCVVATGYGRINVPFADKQKTEILCHARGVASLFPTARSIIDIGGQDSKAIKLKNGRVIDFVMNDKCAAGTGRFLEVIAESLGLGVEEMGQMAFDSKTFVKISNICTVFAEQEVSDKLSDGIPVDELVAGIHESMATSVHRIAKRLVLDKDIVITGGGAKNKGLVKMLSQKFDHPVLVPQNPLITGAMGAALYGKDLVAKQDDFFKNRKERKLKNVTFFE